MSIEQDFGNYNKAEHEYLLARLIIAKKYAEEYKIQDVVDVLTDMIEDMQNQ